MKNIETRQKEYRLRRIKVLIMKVGIVILFGLFLFGIVLAASASRSGYTFDPTKVVLVHFSGIEGQGQAQLEMNKSDLVASMDEAFAKYETAIWPLFKKLKKEDFEALADTITASLDKTENLSNDDALNISLSYNEEMAEKLKIRVKYVDMPLTVSGLEDGTVITDEDIFKDVTIDMEGISPCVSVTVNNNTSNEFIKTVEYSIEPAQDFYEDGQKIKVVANFDKQLSLGMHYDVQMNKNYREYTVECPTSYVTSADQIPASILEEAAEKGKDYFVNANEYGLRIFTSAGLKYTWVGTNDYTFEWSNPRLLSIYLESLKDSSSFGLGKPYNYLELAYEIHISQANGTGCDAEAIVCFNNLTIDENGKVNLNPDSGQLFSASYSDEEIKESLQGWFAEDYDLEKFDISSINYSAE